LTLLLVTCRNGDRRTGAGEAVCHPEPEAAIAASDDGDAAAKIKRVQTWLLITIACAGFALIVRAAFGRSKAAEMTTVHDFSPHPP
jgi:hypothetical protein